MVALAETRAGTNEIKCDPTLEKWAYGALCYFELRASKVNTGASG